MRSAPTDAHRSASCVQNALLRCSILLSPQSANVRAAPAGRDDDATSQGTGGLVFLYFVHRFYGCKRERLQSRV